MALVVAALLLVPYSGLTSEQQANHVPYDQLQDQVPAAFFDSDGDLLRDLEEPAYGTDIDDVDTDDDLCPDGVEVNLWLALAEDAPMAKRQDRMPLGDADRDGTPNILDPDSDNDGLLDGWEFENGLDPADPHTFLALRPDRWQYYSFFAGDPRDLDDDGMPDDWEQALGVQNATDDDDGDGVDNVWEFLNGTDPTGPDILYGDTPTKVDSDHDDVPDDLERVLGLDPFRSDTDGDNVTDGMEMYQLRSSPFDRDTDNDFMSDMEEIQIGSSPIMADTDGDGITDSDEVNTDPTIPDTDKDLIPDAEEKGATRDSDGDGIPDSVERSSNYRNGPTDPFDPDSDNDGLSDGEEDANRNGRREGNDPHDRNSDWRSGGETDPTSRDTDGGGVADQDEIWFQRDPLNPNDDEVNINPPPNNRPPIDPINPPPAINLAGWGRVLLVALLVIFVVLLLGMLYNTAASEEDFLEDLVEALVEGEKVLYAITLTDDVREAIFTAYKRFLSVMEAYGHSKGEPATAREFAASVRAALEIDPAALDEFTTMFELARYSDHEMGLEDRDRALTAFTAVRLSITQNIGPPEKPVAFEEEEEASTGIWARLNRLRGRA